MEPLISWMAFAPWCRLKKVMPFSSHKPWKLPKMHGSTITIYDSSRWADTNLPSDRSHDVWPIASMMSWCPERCSQGFRRSPSRFLMRLTWLASLMMTPSPSGCMMDFGRWSCFPSKDESEDAFPQRWRSRCHAAQCCEDHWWWAASNWRPPATLMPCRHPMAGSLMSLQVESVMPCSLRPMVFTMSLQRWCGNMAANKIDWIRPADAIGNTDVQNVQRCPETKLKNIATQDVHDIRKDIVPCTCDTSWWCPDLVLL